MFVPILAYHKIQSSFDFSITRVSPEAFERQISYLAACGYSTTSIADLQAGNDFEKKIIITFDDAYECVFTHALPVLSNYNFTATIFVISDYVGSWNHWDYRPFKIKAKHCTWAQLNLLASNGWEIGSHTATHRMLSSLTDKQVWFELQSSRLAIEAKIKAPIRVISYPFGRFDRRVLHLARKAGYSAGCTLGSSASCDEFPSLALSRRGVYLLDPFNLFKAKLTDSVWAHYDDLKQRLISSCAQGSAFLRYLQSGYKI